MRKILITIAIVMLLVIASPAGAASKKVLNDTIDLEQKYKLHLEGVYVTGSPRAAMLQLLHGRVVDERVVVQGDNFKLYDGGALIVNATLDSVFVGATGSLVQIRNLVQYDKDTGAIILTMDRVLLLITYNPPVKFEKTPPLKLKQGYELQLRAVDDTASPNQIWLLIGRHGEHIDDQVVALGDEFSLYDGGTLVVTARFDQIFRGSDRYFVLLKDLYQYKQNGEVILYKESVIMEKPY